MDGELTRIVETKDRKAFLKYLWSLPQGTDLTEVRKLWSVVLDDDTKRIRENLGHGLRQH